MNYPVTFEKIEARLYALYDNSVCLFYLDTHKMVICSVNELNPVVGEPGDSFALIVGFLLC